MKTGVVAIVPAAGLGRRFGEDRNKPFETLGNRPVLVWALETFERMPEISEIIPVLKERDIDKGRELFRKFGLSKVRRIAPGGKERQDSIYNGLHFISDTTAVVLVHDGVRPFVEPETVKRALRALDGCDGVVVGVQPKDTIKEVDGDRVARTLRRDALIAVQTPQIFRYGVLLSAYDRAMRESYAATDDAALVEWNGGHVRVVRGEYTNIKVTTPEDIMIAEALLQMRREGQ